MPPELRAQFDTVEAAVRALGVTVWSMGECEADDALATGARLFAEQVDQVRIMTPDKDLAQCLRGDRVVQIDRRQRKLTDEATFRATRGFGPGSVPDFLALTGDTADGIPGLDGFGEKSAGLLIGAYEHIEAIPDRADHWTVKPRGALNLAATLAAHREEALFYRKLATLIDTVPLDRDAGRPALPGHAARTLRRLVRRGGRHDRPHRAPPLARLSVLPGEADRRHVAAAVEVDVVAADEPVRVAEADRPARQQRARIRDRKRRRGRLRVRADVQLEAALERHDAVCRGGRPWNRAASR